MLLKIEEEYAEKMCSEIIAFKPDMVITKKGCERFGAALPGQGERHGVPEAAQDTQELDREGRRRDGRVADRRGMQMNRAYGL